MTENGNGSKIIRFKVDEPIEVALRFDGGREVNSTYGRPQVLFSVVDSTGSERLMYTEVNVARRIEQLKIRAGQPFTITKQKEKCWDIRRVDPPAPAQPPATAAAAWPKAESPAQNGSLEAQLRASIPALVPKVTTMPDGDAVALAAATQLGSALKTVIAAVAMGMKFAKELDVPLVFTGEDIRTMTNTVLIGLQNRNAPTNGNGAGR